MPGINLSTLSTTELRRLRRAARARNDEALADRLDQEIGVRGSAPRVTTPVAPPPRSFAVRRDVEDWEAEDQPAEDGRAGEPEANEPRFEAERPPEPAQPPPFEPAPLEFERREREPRRNGGLPLVGLGVVAGVAASAAVFWSLAGVQTPELPKAARAMAALATPSTAPTQAPAEPVSRPPLAAKAEAAAAPPPAPVTEARPIASVDEPAAASRTAAAEPGPESAPAPHRAPARSVRLATAEPAERPHRRLDPCANPPSPADRLVCNDLALEALDVEMRDAYARALDARADPTVLFAGQAAWRRARNEVADPQRLARLYDQRIRELNAATAAAREAGPTY